MDNSTDFEKLCDLCIHSEKTGLIEQELVRIRDVNECDCCGHTPLYYAITQNLSPEVLEVLLKAGSSVTFTSLCDAVIHNRNPLVAIRLFDILKPLRRDYLDYLFLLSAASCTDDVLVRFFIDNGARCDATIGIDLYPDYDFDDQYEGDTVPPVLVAQNALVLALYENPSPKEMIGYLLASKVDPDFTDSEGHCVLYHALEDIEIVRLLVESGARLDQTDNLGKTPLMIACEGENKEVALYLIEHDKDLDKRSWESKTALHYALSCHLVSNYEVISSLISHGADIESCDGEGHTPLEVAKIHYAHSAVISLLQKALSEKRVIC